MMEKERNIRPAFMYEIIHKELYEKSILSLSININTQNILYNILSLSYYINMTPKVGDYPNL